MKSVILSALVAALSLSTPSAFAQQKNTSSQLNKEQLFEISVLLNLNEKSDAVSKINNTLVPEASAKSVSEPSDVIAAHEQFNFLFQNSSIARARIVTNPCLYSDLITAVAYPNQAHNLGWSAQSSDFQLAAQILETANSLRASANCAPPVNNRCCKDSSGTPNCDTVLTPASCRVDGSNNCEHGSTICN